MVLEIAPPRPRAQLWMKRQSESIALAPVKWIAPPTITAALSSNTQWEKVGRPPSQRTAPPLNLRLEFCLNVQLTICASPPRL